MSKNRLEAFSDGVIAIIITIMVLELKVPHGSSLNDLMPLVAVFFSYILSFIYVAIYWNNHHHLFQLVHKVNGKILWANMHLLFWLTLVPFSTAWVGENGFSQWPVFLYGINLLLCAIAYTILVKSLLKHHRPGSLLEKAIGDDSKGKLSVTLYVLGIAATWVHSLLGYSFFVVVALIWLIPDTRVERVLPEP